MGTKKYYCLSFNTIFFKHLSFYYIFLDIINPTLMYADIELIKNVFTLKTKYKIICTLKLQGQYSHYR